MKIDGMGRREDPAISSQGNQQQPMNISKIWGGAVEQEEEGRWIRWGDDGIFSPARGYF